MMIEKNKRDKKKYAIDLLYAKIVIKKKKTVVLCSYLKSHWYQALLLDQKLNKIVHHSTETKMGDHH